MKFTDLITQEEILKAIEEIGYETPTPIQEKAIPEVLKRSDLRASAQTGTGKTAAFILPAVVRLAASTEKAPRGPRILVLVPTRELAMQVAVEARKYTKYLPKIKTVCVFGGAPYPPQIKDLMKPYDILIATPGRLMDHMERSRIDLSHLDMFVLDEADRMLDMGFIGAVEEIAEATPKTRQTLLFSATLKGSVMKLSSRLLNKPVEVVIESDHSSCQKIDQRMHAVDGIEHKYRLLDHLLTEEAMKQAIVFTSTKHQADKLVDKLHDLGLNAAGLHGGMRQNQRTKTLHRLRREEVRVLVATDVAARGIDVSTITHVINFDLPMSVEDYVHRIGRTGRAGASGIAISFVAPNDNGFVRQIEKFTGSQITSFVVPGFEAKVKASYVSKKSSYSGPKSSSFRSRSGERDAPRRSENRDAPRFAPRSENRDAPRFSPRSSERDAPRRDDRDFPRFAPRSPGFSNGRPSFSEKPSFSQRSERSERSERVAPRREGRDSRFSPRASEFSSPKSFEPRSGGRDAPKFGEREGGNDERPRSKFGPKRPGGARFKPSRPSR